jgi:CheY-like chemotaxis protein
MPTNLNYVLVEDDENDAALVAMVASHLPGARFFAVRDGQEAIEYLVGEHPFTDRRFYPLPQVILLDLDMPRLNGFDFISWLRRDAPRPLSLIPIIVMCSSQNPADLARAYSLGANTCIPKPRRWNEFVACMETLHLYWGKHAQLPSSVPLAV